MKNLILLFIFLSLSSCVSQVKKDSIQKYYFYFDRTQPNMKVYGKLHELRYLYEINNPHNYEPVIFIPKDSIVKEISVEKLKSYDLKDYKWLNTFSGLEIDKFFFEDTPKKEYYLIEKRESNKFLYLRKVYFIQEID